MNTITLLDAAGNEITIFIDGISSCSYMRNDAGVCIRVSVFMKSGESHFFNGEQAEKFDAKMKTL